MYDHEPYLAHDPLDQRGLRALKQPSWILRHFFFNIVFTGIPRPNQGVANLKNLSFAFLESVSKCEIVTNRKRSLPNALEGTSVLNIELSLNQVHVVLFFQNLVVTRTCWSYTNVPEIWWPPQLPLF